MPEEWGQPGRGSRSRRSSVSRFVALQALLIHQSLRDFSPHDSAYGSIYYSLAGIHLAHAAAGVLALGWLVTRPARLNPRHRITLDVVSLYWFFVVVSAVLVFLTLDIAVRA